MEERKCATGPGSWSRGLSLDPCLDRVYVAGMKMFALCGVGALFLLPHSAVAQEPAAGAPAAEAAPQPMAEPAPPPARVSPEAHAVPAPSYYVEPPAAQPALKRRSTGMMIGGIIMSGLGGASVLGGVLNYVAAED